ncbi:MAG TPA: sigma-70 family RNA polymerase sigma factor [Planctomycetota bacterium]|nr:sigma-70 family RNA polymerase sigma factor [Planctomycetota bacterium]
MNQHLSASPQHPAPVIKPEDPAASFNDLVAVYEERLLHAALQILRDESAALRATESAFVQAYQRLESPFCEHPDAVWMYRHLVEACIEQIRAGEAERRAMQRRVGTLSSAPVAPLPDDADIVSRMDQAISSLTPRRRIVFVLAHYEGLRFHQIGEVLSVTTSCARVTYHAALLELYSKLGGEGVKELRASLRPQMNTVEQ